MYREVVRSSGCFHAPETKCDAPGGNKAHQAAVHLRRSVPEPNVYSEFKMDGVGKVAQCTWQGAHQISMDHKSGFHNVPLHPDSWTYFGIYWKGVYYVWTVYVSDGVDHHISTTRLVAPLHNTSATSTCLSLRGSTISGCPTFKQLKLNHPHNSAKRRGR